MDQDTRNKLQRATQQIRQLLEHEFAEQLEGTFDILSDGTVLSEPGKHLDAKQRLTRQKLVAAIEHIKAVGRKPAEAVEEYTREAAFTFLNRFVALRMLEARELLQECVSKGDQSSGFKEFCGLTPGLSSSEDDGYRLYLESLCDELSVEVKVLFDRRSSASLLWPRRSALLEMLALLGQNELAIAWKEDETLGWIYQYFNSDEDRRKARYKDNGKPKPPENSYELAVRNQFFTPRYVVSFLGDNTLGRLWYEMRGGSTRISDVCRYLVVHPNERFESQGEPDHLSSHFQDLDAVKIDTTEDVYVVPYRPKKDPRGIRVLDPACGSGHFLLYAFDLLAIIYEEAWHDNEGPLSEVTGRSLQEDYATLQELYRDLPSLILRHNLYGIDIDSRAAQLCAFALWLRSQHFYKTKGIAIDQRPRITRTNAVAAEPMPGESSLLRDFIATRLSGAPETRLLGQLFREVFDAMRLAGEAGTLLRIENALSDAVHTAKTEWLSQEAPVQQALFDCDPTQEQKSFRFDTTGITDAEFWSNAEERIYEELRNFGRLNSASYETRLFVDDASQGLGFIDVSSQRYDVILMNPPFGSPSTASKSLLSNEYPSLWADIYAAFIQRTAELLSDRGSLGAITSRTYLALPSFEKLRDTLTSSVRFRMGVECGLGVLDEATVRAAFMVADKTDNDPPFVSFWDLRSIDEKDRADVLLQQIVDRSGYHVKLEAFRRIPGKPFAYWLPQHFIELLAEGPYLDGVRLERSQESTVSVAVGASTTDDSRFVRCHWEVPPTTLRTGEWAWFSHALGFCRFYAPTYAVLNWRDRGRELLAVTDSKGNVKPRLRCADDFFSQGLVSPYISERGLGCSFLRRGHIISNSCRGYFRPMVAESLLMPYLNSSVIDTLIWALTPDRKHEAGIIAALPSPPDTLEHTNLDELGGRCWSNTLFLRTLDETNPEFSIDFNGLLIRVEEAIEDVRQASREIDECVAHAFGLELNDLCALRESTGAPHDSGSWLNDDLGFGLAATSCRNRRATTLAIIAVSYAVGTVFGRWTYPASPPDSHLDPLATLPDPHIDDANCRGTRVLVDDQGHDDDIVELVTNQLGEIASCSGQEVHHYLDQTLNWMSDARNWFSSNFFDIHCSQYTRCKRTAPIYWQLSTPSRKFSVWLYYQALTSDTLFKIRNEYVGPKLAHEQRRLQRLRGDAEGDLNASRRREIESQETFVTELTSMDEEIERIAPLWNPSLDDGVIINFAPLWRLVPQNKPWQKECKKTWDKLVKGDYDWAHLAMHLWPERVVPKCVEDASIAIAHGLEDVFWEQDDRDRYQQKEEPEGGWEPVIAELVEERTSPAVKAALQSLLDAPAPSSTSTRRRRRAART